MQDPLDISFLKQDIEFVQKSHKDLMRSYISLSADCVALQGLILDIASETGVDTDKILDTFEKAKVKKKK
jgi:hypothetical protein